MMQKPTQQPELPNDQPEHVEVNGDGLRQWCTNPCVWVDRMTVTRHNAIWRLHLTWLDGRTLRRLGDHAPATMPTVAETPVAGIDTVVAEATAAEQQNLF